MWSLSEHQYAISLASRNFQSRVEYLRNKGVAKAAKKADRIAAEGLANVYIDGNKAAIIEVNSETDFVSKNENFKSMVDSNWKSLFLTSKCERLWKKH